MTGRLLKRPIERIAYRRDEAAAALGVSPATFDELVKDGQMPKPVRLRGCVLWSVQSLFTALAALENAAGVDSRREWD